MLMNKVLFIARYSEGISTGASVITMRNLDMLIKVHGEEHVHVLWLFNKSQILQSLLDTLLMRQAGVNKDSIQKIKEKISNEGITHVFIDTSLAGRCARNIKKLNNQIKVALFFHNAELDYFKSLLWSSLKIWHVLTLIAVWYNERLGIKYSDQLLFLNKRDQNSIYKQYQLAKGKKTDIIPTSLHDRFNESLICKTASKELNVLFVGTLFFPNYHGVKWFFEEVLPHVDIKLTIVGKGFETVAAEFSHPKVTVVGSVKNIDPYYYESDFVIAPIFKGSGMKTKLAEALMFGKSVLASTESFEGYDINIEKVGALCNNQHDYIEAIKNFKRQPMKFNKVARNYFLSNYDFSRSCQIYSQSLIS
jgi:glycosyltransferase involved in cell wall biosynthesis